jgi:hypothetical protein
VPSSWSVRRVRLSVSARAMPGRWQVQHFHRTCVRHVLYLFSLCCFIVIWSSSFIYVAKGIVWQFSTVEVFNEIWFWPQNKNYWIKFRYFKNNLGLQKSGIFKNLSIIWVFTDFLYALLNIHCDSPFKATIMSAYECSFRRGNDTTFLCSQEEPNAEWEWMTFA